MGIRTYLVALLFASCAKPSNPVDPSSPPERWKETADLYTDVLTSHREGGWLVARTPDGDRDQGDSLTFTGEAMGLDCPQASLTLDALERMQETYAGYYLRVEPLPDHYWGEKNVVSRDGWIGVMYGMTRAWVRCPDLKARMTASWKRARAAVGAASTLHPAASSAFITPTFRYVQDLVSRMVEETSWTPPDAARVAFEGALMLSVRSVVGSKGACYPLRLGLLQLLTASAVGFPISDGAKRDLCEASASSGLMTWRWYCQDSSGLVESWLEQYQPNQIVYAHQRCSWETEDFPVGASYASLDWLTLRDLYLNGE